MDQNAASHPPTFTTVLPLTQVLPRELALLLAPVAAEAANGPEAYVGRADGVILDAEGRVVAFVVRLALRLDDRGARTLVPPAAMTLTEGPMLHLVWTEEQLRAHPRVDENGQPKVTSFRPSLVAAGPDLSGNETTTEGLEGSLLGAALGGLAGLAIGGPLGAVALGVFFATGGGFLGALAGAAEDARARPVGESFAPLGAEDPGALALELGRLEGVLRAPGVAAGLVSTVQLTPMWATEVSPGERVREVAGWR